MVVKLPRSLHCIWDQFCCICGYCDPTDDGNKKYNPPRLQSCGYTCCCIWFHNHRPFPTKTCAKNVWKGSANSNKGVLFTHCRSTAHTETVEVEGCGRPYWDWGVVERGIAEFVWYQSHYWHWKWYGCFLGSSYWSVADIHIGEEDELEVYLVTISMFVLKGFGKGGVVRYLVLKLKHLWERISNTVDLCASFTLWLH